jgi:predicted permease
MRRDSRIAGIRRLFRLPESKQSIEVDIGDEIRFHLDQRTEDLVRQGHSRDRARQIAEREYGDVISSQRELGSVDRHRLRRERLSTLWDTLNHDFRHAARSLARQPGFALTVVITVALAIGVNATMFGVIDRLLLKPPDGVTEPARVFRLYFTRTFSWAGLVTQDGTSFPDFVLFRDQATSFEHVAAFLTTKATLGRGSDAQQVRRTVATAGFFPLLGVRPAIGRFFTVDEDKVPVGEPVMVLSHALWKERFGERPEVVGSVVHLGNRAYTVIGVAPAGFTGVDLEPSDLWVPLSAEGGTMAGEDWHRSRRSTWIRIIARLRPTASVSQADAEATALFQRGLAESTSNTAPAMDSTARAALGPLDVARGPVSYGATRSVRVATWLSAMALVVLLIAGANIVNLLLMRGAQRQRDIAVRAALGINRGRLVRMLLTESVLLTCVGGAAGFLLAFWGSHVVRELLLPGIAWGGPPIDGRVLLVTVVLTVATGVLTGLAPALQAGRLDVVSRLRAGAREGTYRRSAARSALLILQAGLAMVLLVGAGLFVRSLDRVLGLDMGFDASRVLVAELDVSGVEITGTRLREYYREARERVSRVPGIDGAALATSIPFYSSTSARLRVPGRDSLPATKDGGPYIVEVTPEYFPVMGTRIIRGRGFLPTDREGAPRVAIVSETFARLVWPAETALGKCLRIGADTVPCTEIVGVAQDAKRQTLATVPVMQYYVPLDQRQIRMSAPVLLVRTRADQSTPVSLVRRELQRELPDAPYIDIRSLETLVDPQIQPWHLGAAMFALFGFLALLIAALGLYGVIAYEVVQRRHEFGVRLALGATPASVLGLVIGRAVRLVVFGLGAGSAIALGASGHVEALLFDTSPRDPWVFAAVGVTLIGMALLAGAIPSWRAMRVDPAITLRTE